MAKKKDEEPEKVQTDIDYYEKVGALLKKRAGRDVIFGSEEIADRPKLIIPVSPSLDLSLGGGILSGSMTIISGPPKLGKTTTALQICRNAQKLGKFCYYINAEHRLRERDLKGIAGLDMSRLKVIQSEEGAILSAVDLLEMSRDIIKTHPHCVLVMDSFSALSTDEDLNDGLDKQTRGGNGKLLSKFFAAVSNIYPVNDITLIGILHVMANVTGYGAPTTEKGGFAVKYYGDTKLRGKKTEDWKVAERQIGQLVHWDIDFSSLSGPGTAVSRLRYGKGLCRETEILALGVDVGLIEKTEKGGYYTFPGGEKAHGEAQAYEFLCEHPEVTDELEQQVKGMLV